MSLTKAEEKLAQASKDYRNLFVSNKDDWRDWNAYSANPRYVELGEIWILLNISKERRILNAKWFGSGAEGSLGFASLLTRMLPGKTLAEAGRITAEDIAITVGISLSSSLTHYALPALSAMKAAVRIYPVRK